MIQSAVLQRRHLSPGWRAHLAALVLYAATVAFWLHGIVFHPSSEILRGIADGTSQLRDYWAAGYQHKTPFTFARDQLNGAPEGRPIADAIQVAEALQPGFVWVVSKATGLIAAWNIFIVVGFIGTSFSLFALAWRIGCGFVPSLFAGYVFGFNPWAFERAQAGAPAFLQGWIFVVMIVALYYARRRTWWSAVPGGAAFAGAFYVASYFGLLACVVFGLYWAIEYVRLRGLAHWLRTTGLLLVAIVSATVCYAPALVAYLRNPQLVSNEVSNPAEEIQNLGASIREYFLPYGHHPFLGGITRAVPGSGNFPDTTMFFGYSTIVLAAVGLVLVLRRTGWIVADPRRLRTARFAALLIPLAFYFSLKSHVHFEGVTVPAPSALTSHVTTLWRVYARIGLLVGLGLAVLAALTLSMAQKRFGMAAPLAALALLAGVEFLPGRIATFDANAAPAYVWWLRSHPGGIVASYPAPTDTPEALALAQREYWYQHFHAHPLYTYFGSGVGGTREDAIRILSRYVNDPRTPGILATEHVRYVVVHDDVYRAENVKPPTSLPGMQLVAHLGAVRIFRLDSSVEPVDLDTLLAQDAGEVADVEGLRPPVVHYDGGFGHLQAGARPVARMAHLTLQGTDTSLKRVQITLYGFSAQPATVYVENTSGTPIQIMSLKSTPTFYVIGPVSFSSPMRLTFVSSQPWNLQPLNVIPVADYSVSLAR